MRSILISINKLNISSFLRKALFEGIKIYFHLANIYYNFLDRMNNLITYQALDMSAVKYVMYKIPVQRHNAVSSQIYHLI